MNTLAIVAFYLAAFHIIYEMTLAPSFRYILRFRLFAIRDRLRWLRLEHGHQLDADVFSYVDESLTWQMNNHHRLNFSLLVDVKKLKAEMHQDVEDRLTLLARCKLPEFITIQKDATRAMSMAFLANSGAWFIYIIPLAIVAAFYGMLKDALKRLLVMPERDLNKFAQSSA